MDASLPKKHRPHQEITLIPLKDERYPPLLRHITDPPPLLYIRGEASALSHPCPVAVIGSRKMTAYGSTAVRLIVGPAARRGLAIVSGLALGVDAAAHTAALDAGGLTVAVLAGGVDAASVGPRSNAALAERILASGGALVSEFPPGTESYKSGFPRRNRIIAGMTLGTVVIEAAEKSGSLITARLALDADRDVFAVPGQITSSASAGTNGLLRSGAVPLTCADDLLHAYGLAAASPVTPPTDSRERAVLERIAAAPHTADALASATGLPMRDVLAITTALTLKNLIIEDRGTFIKN